MGPSQQDQRLINIHHYLLFILTLLTKALRSKRREFFLSILGSYYTTLDAKLFEDAATLLPGYTGTCHSPHVHWIRQTCIVRTALKTMAHTLLF